MGISPWLHGPLTPWGRVGFSLKENRSRALGKDPSCQSLRTVLLNVNFREQPSCYKLGNAFKVFSFILRSHTKFLFLQLTWIAGSPSFQLLRYRCSQELNFHGICGLSIMFSNIYKSLECFLQFVLARNSWSLLHSLSCGTDLINVLSRLLFRETLASLIA